MNRRRAGWIAWSLWLVSLAALGRLLVVGDVGSGSWGFASGAVFLIVFATTGALVASRVPDNPIGWLLCLAALAFSIGALCEQVVLRSAQSSDPGYGVVVAAWLNLVVWVIGLGLPATFVLLLFPDGHLPSPRWRVVGRMAALGLLGVLVGLALRPGPIDDTTIVNPLGVPPELAWLTRALQAAGLVLVLVSVVLSGASLVVRYRAAGAHQRHQLQWLAYSVPVVLVSWTAAIVLGAVLEGDLGVDVTNALISGGLVAVPLAIGVAMLRHRLYDIELVISRTLVYTTLTVSLVVVYLASVLLLRLALAPVTGDSDLAVAASTLAVAALFRPLRSALQRGVDRRFFRSRYDAARTLDEFTGRLRHELDLDSLGTDLRTVVHDTMQPAHLSLWLRRPSDEQLPSVRGNDSRTPTR